MVRKRDLNAEELKIYEELEAQHQEEVKTAKARLEELEKDPEYDGSIYVGHYCDGMGDDDGTLHTLNKMLVEDGFMPGGPFEVKLKSKAMSALELMRSDGIDPIAVAAKEEKITLDNVKSLGFEIIKDTLDAKRLEKLTAAYEEAEQNLNTADDILDNPHRNAQDNSPEKSRKAAHDKMIKLGHKIITKENRLNARKVDSKRDYFSERAQADKKQAAIPEQKMDDFDAEQEQSDGQELTTQDIVNSDMPWEEKKKRYAEIYETEKINETEQDLEKDEDELEL